MDLPDKWKITPLSDVCQFKPPKSIPRTELAADAQVSFVPMNDLGEASKNFTAADTRPLESVIKGYTYFADGDVICAKITPCFENGKLGLAQGLSNGVGFGSSEFVVMRTSPKLDAEYLYYFLARDEFRETGQRVMSGAVGHKRVPKEYFETLPIPLPPLEEQKRIVAMLDQAFTALDRARAHAEANLEDAEALPQAAIDEIFLNKEADWTVTTLGKACTFVGGSQPPKSVFKSNPEPGLIRLIQIRDYKSDAKAVYIPEDLARRFCEPDDVMIGRYGPPLFQILRGIRGAYNVALMKAVPNSKLISKAFLFYFLKNREILRYIIEPSSRAAGQAGINKATIEPYPISYPDLNQQAEIVERLETIWELSRKAQISAQTKLADLADLRQSLLQKAFSGQL